MDAGMEYLSTLAKCAASLSCGGRAMLALLEPLRATDAGEDTRSEGGTGDSPEMFQRWAGHQGG
eukprot:5663046-Pyramimonas_sp.AAC.1